MDQANNLMIGKTRCSANDFNVMAGNILNVLNVENIKKKEFRSHGVVSEEAIISIERSS